MPATPRQFNWEITASTTYGLCVWHRGHLLLSDVYMINISISMINLSVYLSKRDSFLNSSPPGQNSRHSVRRHFQMHFHEWNVLYWRNWYLVFGHGCDTTDSQMSPQPRRSRGCGDIWESVVSQPWPKTRYQFLFYHGTTKLTLNLESLSSQTPSQLPKFKEQSHCKHWVRWPDCFATPSNHCDVTTGIV